MSEECSSSRTPKPKRKIKERKKEKGKRKRKKEKGKRKKEKRKKEKGKKEKGKRKKGKRKKEKGKRKRKKRKKKKEKKKKEKRKKEKKKNLTSLRGGHIVPTIAPKTDCTTNASTLQHTASSLLGLTYIGRNKAERVVGSDNTGPAATRRRGYGSGRRVVCGRGVW